jgi:hypothetical protein
MATESNQGAYRLVRLENGKMRSLGDLRATLGGDSPALLQSILSYFETGGNGNTLTAINAKLALMHALAPRDELEGLLIAQMVTAHSLAREYLADGSSEKNLQGARLLNLFARQMQQLQTYRSQHKVQASSQFPEQLFSTAEASAPPASAKVRSL